MSKGDIGDKPYIVLLGDVGTGKSTIVEKITGQRGLSSKADKSETRSSQPYYVPGGSLVICDTPGSNASEEELEHNTHIATAMNFAPVSKIMIVSKAEMRIDNTVSAVRKYAERIIDLPEDIIGVIITHMDIVTWTTHEFRNILSKKLGIETVVFTGIQDPSHLLLQDILECCKDAKPHDLMIDSNDFLRFFKIDNYNLMIIRSINQEVKNFEQLKEQFDVKCKEYKDKELLDVLFQFQAWMPDLITEAQRRLSDKCQFTFIGAGGANEAGHVANMTNQLRAILYVIRSDAVALQGDHGVDDLRSCPHCGDVWMKVEGCEGSTTCGRRPTTFDSTGEMATFKFEWINKKFKALKTGTKKAISAVKGKKTLYGCGKKIKWTTMQHVDIPQDLAEGLKVTTGDIRMLPPNEAKPLKKQIQEKLDKQLECMKIKGKEFDFN